MVRIVLAVAKFAARNLGPHLQVSFFLLVNRIGG